MSERVLRVRDAAKTLGVSTRTIRRYIDVGRLVAVQLPSGHYRIREDELLDLIRERADENERAFDR